ncbi:hypothetical protein ACSBR2_014037 [Camellia fascicularis]
MFSPTNMRETVTTLFSAYASLSALVMLFRSNLNQLIPHQLQSYLLSRPQKWFKTQPSSSNLTLVVKKLHGFGKNQVYEAATTYLTTKIGPSNNHLVISKVEKKKHISIALITGEEIIDSFQNIEVKWKLCKDRDSNSASLRRKYYKISFDKQFRESVLNAYLPYVMSTSASIKEKEKVVKIYKQGSGRPWDSIRLEHPITIEKLAMDPELKRLVMDDLTRFVGEERVLQEGREGMETRLTLWGILNVIDGLWSSCGHERIIVFTTNHKDRLDPALLSPGRMDMHINMSYCTTHEIESLLENVEITPAEVAEQFMKSEDVDVCLRGLIKLLKKKIKSSEIKDENEGTVGIEEVKRPELDGKK